MRRELAFLAIHKKKIDIGAVIQLAAAKFSEGKNDKLRHRRTMALSQFRVPMFENVTNANLRDL